MLGLGVSEELQVALLNAGLLALWAVLPVFVIGYTRQLLVARRLRAEFSLRHYEALELNRALTEYEKVWRQRKELIDQGAGVQPWWRTLIHSDNESVPQRADEFEEVDAHARYLQGTIIRLKRGPLQRLKKLVRILSWRFALGGALAVHVSVLALLVVALQSSWAGELIVSVKNPLTWYPLDARIFYANAAAAMLAAVWAPAFLLLRWLGLRRRYSFEYCALKEFAYGDPNRVIEQLKADGEIPPVDINDDESDDSWFKVLGLSHSATIEEVKEAYKALIKQNHPDRVHGMAPAFMRLAETETKKLNAAYQYALFSLPQLESRQTAAAD
jgi:DnaJ-domain-containing protein 1